MKFCSYCGEYVKEDELLEEGYTINRIYDKICIHCLEEKQIEDKMLLKKYA